MVLGWDEFKKKSGEVDFIQFLPISFIDYLWTSYKMVNSQLTHCLLDIAKPIVHCELLYAP